ncbi:branched-chain amino acid ABC transporter permease [Geobacter sp.]|uniref:branched-chain amino acid ABC transporter permease n=1 Tax=Geobacter sp. TaxID=46610 RepID=UPI00263962BB|nr:branched-chain amino acid ABC transporter permease [Geobacter sp.]
MTALILQSLYSGLLSGGSYALIALGLALVFGTMKIINLAHGEMVLLSAYMAYVMENRLAVNPLLATPLALVVACLIAVVVYFLVSRISRNRELNSLILTFGIGIILTNAALIIWSADIHSTSAPGFQEPVVLGPLYSMRSELGFFVASMVLVAALWWWLSRSWYGRAVRAVSSNRDAAKLMGINPHRTEVVSFVVAGILASVAGVAIYSTGVIQPALGASLTTKAFIITVLAGIGSIPGVLVGAVLIGVVEALTVTLYSSAIQELTGMALFLLVLFVLPNGLFGAARRRG